MACSLGESWLRDLVAGSKSSWSSVLSRLLMAVLMVFAGPMRAGSSLSSMRLPMGSPHLSGCRTGAQIMGTRVDKVSIVARMRVSLRWFMGIVCCCR